MTAGDKVQVKVLDVNPERQRLSLSIKALEEAPAREENDRPRRSRRPRQSAPTNYSTSEEEGSATLGDAFGDIFKDFD